MGGPWFQSCVFECIALDERCPKGKIVLMLKKEEVPATKKFALEAVVLKTRLEGLRSEDFSGLSVRQSGASVRKNRPK